MDRDYWPTREWVSSAPEEQGVSTAALERLDPVIRAEYGNTLGIVIVRHGRLIYERYYGRTSGDCAHVFSATKSVLSALVGIVLEQGLSLLFGPEGPGLSPTTSPPSRTRCGSR